MKHERTMIDWLTSGEERKVQLSHGGDGGRFYAARIDNHEPERDEVGETVGDALDALFADIAPKTTTPNVDAKAGPYGVRWFSGLDQFAVMHPSGDAVARFVKTMKSDALELCDQLNTAYAQGQRAANERLVEACQEAYHHFRMLSKVDHSVTWEELANQMQAALSAHAGGGA
jgi:hypothetical protein